MTAAPALLVFFVLCALGISAVLLAPERWQPRVEVPGQPPPPLAILHGLLVAVGRRPPAQLSPLSPVEGSR
jgi:hypothetical protein